MSGPIVGVDVGGTFTDLFLHDAATGALRTSACNSASGQREAKRYKASMTDWLKCAGRRVMELLAGRL